MAAAQREATPTTGLTTAFDFQPTTRVVYGAGALERLGQLVASLNVRRVLFVTDPGLEAVGHDQKALSSLAIAGVDVAIFDRVEENPTTRHVEAGVQVAKARGVEAIVALGGGSAMDCAKGINFIYTNGGRMQDYWGTGKAVKPMLPSVGIPTTAGTGSEAQSYALIADPDSHLKMACGDKKAAFRVAILDPLLTISQPVRVTTFTGLDAMSHALESYVTVRRNVLSQVYAREAWRLLHANFERVLAEPNNVTARAAMQLGAHFAGTAIENAMLGAAHALANPLTAHFGLPHGQAVALMLPHVIRYNAHAVGMLYDELALLVGLIDTPGQGGQALAERMTNLAAAAGLATTLSACGVNRNILPVLADEAAEQWTGKFNPRPVAYVELLGLYELAW